MHNGFLSRLFDFSFRSFVTTSIIKVVYIIALVGAVLVTLMKFIGIASNGGGAIVLAIVVAPIVLAISVIFARVYMEVLIVVFRIAENTEIIARESERRS